MTRWHRSLPIANMPIANMAIGGGGTSKRGEVLLPISRDTPWILLVPSKKFLEKRQIRRSGRIDTRVSGHGGIPLVTWPAAAGRGFPNSR